MTSHEFKNVLIFLRKTEKEMTLETFIMIFGNKATILWQIFRNLDYSLNLLLDCMEEGEKNKLTSYLASHYPHFV